MNLRLQAFQLMVKEIFPMQWRSMDRPRPPYISHASALLRGRHGLWKMPIRISAGPQSMPRHHQPSSEIDAPHRIATTVKLDTARHRRLRLLGVDEGRSSQSILVDALDAYLAAREREASRRPQGEVQP
jgi:hypothetical protein